MPTFPLILTHAQLDLKNAKTLARIANETNTEHTPTHPGATISHLGDERQLRGIPAIGKGVQGAITGTRPGATH